MINRSVIKHFSKYSDHSLLDIMATEMSAEYVSVHESQPLVAHERNPRQTGLRQIHTQ